MPQRDPNEELKHQFEELKYQLGRLVSDWESEKDNRKNLDRIVNAWNKIQEIQQSMLDKHDSILRNGNGGLQLRVDRLEQKASENRLRLTMWLSIVSGAVGLLSLIMQMTRI